AAGTPAAAVLREAPVEDPEGYAEIFGTANAWETTYLHLLPADGAEHPVLRWMEGTALRPVRAVLDDTAWHDLRTELAARLADAYPIRDGRVAFPFRRVFVVART
ncbi:trans-aconitate 2-methyltransferase, partial [Actinoplanes sp. NPDC051633]